jgi:Tol biopolymer transport system component
LQDAKSEQKFNPVDLKTYQEKYKTAKIAYLERKLQQLRGAHNPVI